MKKAYFFSFMPVICWQKVKHFLLSRTVSYWKLWVPVDWITSCSHPQNLISEARDLTDQALQLLQTATGILNTSTQHVSNGESNYQVHIRHTDVWRHMYMWPNRITSRRKYRWWHTIRRRFCTVQRYPFKSKKMMIYWSGKKFPNFAQFVHAWMFFSKT